MRNDQLEGASSLDARLSNQEPDDSKNSDCHKHGFNSSNPHSNQEKYDNAKYQCDNYPFENHVGCSLAIGNREVRR